MRASADLGLSSNVLSEGDRALKLQGCDSNGNLWLSKAVTFVQELEKDTKHVSLAVDVDEEIVADRSKALEALKAVQGGSALSPDVKKGLEILLAFGLLQTSGDDVKAYESLEVSPLSRT
jgi:DNA polymerase phi